MSILDAFNTDMFNMVSLTAAIDLLPFKPGRIGELGLFAPKPISTTTAVVEERAGILRLLPTKRRGEPASVGVVGKRTVRSFAVPHIPHEDTVWADDVEGVRAFGSENTAEVLTQVVNDKLAVMKANFDLTWEHMRAGAVKGIILDADGSTLFNLFTEFSVSQQTVDFVLGTTTTNEQGKCLDVLDAIETALGGINYTGVMALAGKTWFRAFVNHTAVKAAYERWRDGEALRSDPRKKFEFCGIVFEEYRNAVGDRQFIDEDKVQFFPLGVPQLFQVVYSPANFIETVNTLGKPLYVKTKNLDLDVGVRLHGQSNPLFMCNIPAVLVEGSTSN